MASDIISFSGSLLVPVDSQRMGLMPGTIAVEGRKIVHLELGVIRENADFGGPDCIISPGFVDIHLHLPQFDSIGQDGMELLTWLERVIFPAESKWGDVDFARDMCHRVAVQLLSYGTTSIAAYATSHSQSAQAALDLLGEMGFSGCVGQVLMDQNAPADLLVPASAALSQAFSMKARGDLKPAVTPRFAIACSSRMLQLSGELAAKTGWMIQTHLSESVRECEAIARMYGGSDYVSVYQQAGLVTERTIFGHGIHLSETERQTLAKAHSIIAHCPAANRFLDAGQMNAAANYDAGVRFGLGSDIGAGTERSMVRVGRGMIETAKQVAHRGDSLGKAGPSTAPHVGIPQDVPGAAHAWWQITAGNAALLGLHDRGTLAVNSVADLLVIRPAIPWQNSHAPLSTLLYAWDDRWLEWTFLQGRAAWRHDEPATALRD